jgi:predicted PurR-regulated permease PerM
MDSLLCLQAGDTKEYMMRCFDNIRQGGSEFFAKHAGSILTSCLSVCAWTATVLLLIIVSMVALCKDMRVVHRIYRSSPFFGAVHQVALTMKKTGIAYLKSQGIILLVIWLICSIGLLLIHNPYCILLGCGIAVFDTFPVLGSGMIFVPWGLFEVFRQNYIAGLVLFITFLLCVVVRDLLEAHLMGNNMGLLPFFMTAALYVGVCLFGVSGIVLGPFGVILIRAIYRQFVT